MCDLDSIDVIVADSGAPMDLVIGLRARGLEVVVAPIDLIADGPGEAGNAE